MASETARRSQWSWLCPDSEIWDRLREHIGFRDAQDIRTALGIASGRFDKATSLLSDVLSIDEELAVRELFDGVVLGLLESAARHGADDRDLTQ